MNVKTECGICQGTGRLPMKDFTTKEQVLVKCLTCKGLGYLEYEKA